MRFVVPVTHIGEPEMMTRTSPGRTVPSASSVASTSASIASVVSAFRTRREATPHESARRRRAPGEGVSAMIGTSGRSLEIRRAENPDSVNATIARASSAWAAVAAASAIASGKPARRSPRRAGRTWSYAW